ncbi:MAG: hypothetical protein KF712_15890 [Akkermansiaceae bacterium]|nr:hypothetical protein [Akkermansiaceae bacterium]
MGALLGFLSNIATAVPVSLADYAAHKDGEDWAPAIRKALAASPEIHIPEGRYMISEVKLADGMTIRGSGNETVLVPLGTRLFDINGSVGKEIPITKDIADFSDTIELKNKEGLAPGDDILIRGQRNSMIREGTAGVNYSTDWVLGRTRKSSCFYGEFDTVKSIEGLELTTGNKRLFPDYFKDDTREPPSLGKDFIQRKSTTVSKLSLVKNVTLRDFKIEGTKKCCMPFRVRYAKDCLLENITFSTNVESFKKDGDPDLSVVYAIYVRDTTVRNFTVELSPELLAILNAKEKAYVNFSNYNLFKIISSTRSGLENCTANGGTHPFNITRSASVESGGGIPSIDCFIRNCVASNCIWSGLKVQQGCFNTKVTGNTVTASAQGIIICGRNTTVTNNNVSTQHPYSTDFYYTHVRRGGTFGIAVIEGYSCGTVIKDNVISGFYSGIAMVDGYESKNIFEEGNIVIENNTVDKAIRGFSLYKNNHGKKLGTKNLNVRIAGNSFTCTESTENRETAGIYLPSFSAGFNISGNTFVNFKDGVSLSNGTDLINITDNTFRNCQTEITRTK